MIDLGNIQDVPTYGAQWYLIDYGSLLNSDFPIDNSVISITGQSEKEALKEKYIDTARFLINTIERPITEIIQKQNLKVLKFRTLAKKLQKTHEYRIDISKDIPKELMGYTKEICVSILFILKYPTLYYDMMGLDVEKYKRYIIKFSPEMQSIYAYIIKNITTPMKCVRYLRDKFFY